MIDFDLGKLNITVDLNGLFDPEAMISELKEAINEGMYEAWEFWVTEAGQKLDKFSDKYRQAIRAKTAPDGTTYLEFAGQASGRLAGVLMAIEFGDNDYVIDQEKAFLQNATKKVIPLDVPGGRIFRTITPGASSKPKSTSNPNYSSKNAASTAWTWKKITPGVMISADVEELITSRDFIDRILKRGLDAL